MSTDKVAARHELDAALGRVQHALSAAIKAEQLSDQLTGLPNDAALTEWISSKIDSGGAFWVAFVEVDRFKNINDEFGYEDADEILRRIADQLRNAAANFLGSGSVPFRAHGDEFYVAGVGDGGGVGTALDLLRKSIAALRVRADGPKGKGREMQCTVSVGWLTSTDGATSTDPTTHRSIRGRVDMTVAEAKRTRDCVLRYSKKFRSPQTRAGRADCPTCRCKFELWVPTSDSRAGMLGCPNCHVDVERPSALCLIAPAPRTVKSLKAAAKRVVKRPKPLMKRARK